VAIVEKLNGEINAGIADAKIRARLCGRSKGRLRLFTFDAPLCLFC